MKEISRTERKAKSSHDHQAPFESGRVLHSDADSTKTPASSPHIQLFFQQLE
jgi:hypothetical protein